MRWVIRSLRQIIVFRCGKLGSEKAKRKKEREKEKKLFEREGARPPAETHKFWEMKQVHSGNLLWTQHGFPISLGKKRNATSIYVRCALDGQSTATKKVVVKRLK